jgi:hypothetical protein
VGHVHIENLPRTKSWRAVVKGIRDGDDAPTVAAAVVKAARGVLLPFATDPGVVEATWHLIRLPLAAQDDDFPDALRRLGLDVRGPATLMGVLAAVSDALDRATRPAARTDLGEMAQTALVETLADRFGVRSAGLFDPAPGDLHAALAATATAKQFGLLAAAFFARLVRKALDFFLSRVLVNQVGAARRFRTLAAQAAFADALRVYAGEVAAGVAEFAGGWFKKWDHATGGRIAHDEAGAFLAHAAHKLTWGLERG